MIMWLFQVITVLLEVLKYLTFSWIHVYYPSLPLETFSHCIATAEV